MKSNDGLHTFIESIPDNDDGDDSGNSGDNDDDTQSIIKDNI